MRRRNVKDFPLSNADFLDLRSGAKNNSRISLLSIRFGRRFQVETARLSGSAWPQYDEFLSNDGWCNGAPTTRLLIRRSV
jgi:hypothetical protein